MIFFSIYVLEALLTCRRYIAMEMMADDNKASTNQIQGGSGEVNKKCGGHWLLASYWSGPRLLASRWSVRWASGSGGGYFYKLMFQPLKGVTEII